MRLYAWTTPEGNVGDDLNGWMWPRLLGDVFDGESDEVFIGVGSVLDRRHDGARRRIVCGAGARSPATVPDIREPGWDVRFVRGPRTAAALGLGDDRWISDPAILAPLVYDRPPPEGPKAAIGFVPYYRTRLSYAAALAEMSGMRLIPTSLDPETFISRLLGCERIVAEAMHGAILADAFGVPWRPLRISSRKVEGDTHDFKWGDWLESMSLSPEFVSLPYPVRRFGDGLSGQFARLAVAWRGSKILRKYFDLGKWNLSDRALMKSKQSEMINIYSVSQNNIP